MDWTRLTKAFIISLLLLGCVVALCGLIALSIAYPLFGTIVGGIITFALTVFCIYGLLGLDREDK